MTGLVAEHGFGALVTVRRGDRTTSVLFDTGLSPDALVTNADRLQVDLTAVQGVVLSHGHFDHAGGLAGLARRLGPSRMPIVVHPYAWTRRRLVPPGAEPTELPTLDPRALAAEGFTLVERKQPSLLVDGCVLITGEVDRVTDFEHGMPPAHQAWTGEAWQHDPAGDRRPGPRRARPRPRAGRPHRLRARRCGQHRPPCPAAHRRRPPARPDRRAAPQRPRVRTGDPADRGGADRARPGARRCRATAPAGAPSTRSPPPCPRRGFPAAAARPSGSPPRRRHLVRERGSPSRHDCYIWSARRLKSHHAADLVGVAGFEPTAPRSQSEVRPSGIVHDQPRSVRIGGRSCAVVGRRCCHGRCQEIAAASSRAASGCSRPLGRSPARRG